MNYVSFLRRIMSMLYDFMLIFAVLMAMSTPFYGFIVEENLLLIIIIAIILLFNYTIFPRLVLGKWRRNLRNEDMKN